MCTSTTTSTPQSLPASYDSIIKLYPEVASPKYRVDRELGQVVRFLESGPDLLTNDFTCFFDSAVIDEFFSRFTESYPGKQIPEGWVMFGGFWLHHPQDEQKKAIFVTTFYPFDVVIGHYSGFHPCFSKICSSHWKDKRILPLVWAHTQPFDRSTFSRELDRYDPLRLLNAPYQMGLWIDKTTVPATYTGYKIKDGVVYEEPRVYSVTLGVESPVVTALAPTSHKPEPKA